MNFEDDLRLEIQRVCFENGIKINLKSELRKLLLDYLTVRTKIIEPKIRKIFISPVLDKQKINHPKRKEIEQIILSAKTGQDLNKFQSRKLFETNFHDHLQNEWNIYHFHLSTEISNQGYFVKSVNSLLFAYIDEKNIVFLGCATHIKGIFGDVKWIEILHDYFPKIIEIYKDEKLSDISPKLNAIQTQSLWNNGFSLGMTKVRDTVYHNPGIGRAVSGHSLNVSLTANDIIRWLHAINKELTDSINEVCNYLMINPNDAKFSVKLGKKTLELYESESDTTILNFPDHLMEKEEILEKIKTINK